MSTGLREAPRILRVEVGDFEVPHGVGRIDYADAFEVRLSEPYEPEPEQFVRTAIEKTSAPIRWGMQFAWRVLLGLRMGPRSSPDHILGWPIVQADAELVHLRASSWLIQGSVVGRKVEPTRAVVTTYVTYERPRASRAVWAVVAPLHRRAAGYLMARAALSRR